MNPSDELHALLALTCTPHVGVILGRRLVEGMGTAKAVYENRTELSERIPGVRSSLISALDCPAALKQAEEEIRYIEKNHIRCLTINDKEYPSRLRECEDAPLVIYTYGNADLNSKHIVSIVGTRRATNYGRDICEAFVSDLAKLCPDALVVSGLAYGIDVAAHRAALANNLPTIGVLAHGLDRIYPSTHRSVASEMIHQGGLVTEFMSFTTPERQNFVKRNRIIAGLADATVVVESAQKGGSLITADFALNYGRECFAFPGRISDENSRGCNALIQNNGAALICSAEDFLKGMNWETSATDTAGVQKQLFPEMDLTSEETMVMEIIRKNEDGIHIDSLMLQADIPINRLRSMLFNLEMKGLVRPLPGACYRAVTL